MVPAIVESFEKCASGIEFKIFMFSKIYFEMTPIDFDRILHSFEKRLLPLEGVGED